MSRRSNERAAAAGIVFVLFAAALAALGIKEVFRYRPRLYRPAAPDSYHEVWGLGNSHYQIYKPPLPNLSPQLKSLFMWWKDEGNGLVTLGSGMAVLALGILLWPLTEFPRIITVGILLSGIVFFSLGAVLSRHSPRQPLFEWWQKEGFAIVAFELGLGCLILALLHDVLPVPILNPSLAVKAGLAIFLISIAMFDWLAAKNTPVTDWLIRRVIFGDFIYEWGGVFGWVAILGGFVYLAFALFNVGWQLHPSLQWIWLGLSPCSFIVGIYGLRHPLRRDKPFPPTTVSLPWNQPVAYTVYPQRGKADFVSGQTFMQTLLSVAPRLTFQIVGEPGAIYWQIIDPLRQYDSSVLVDHVHAHLPGTAITQTTPTHSPFPFFRQLHFFRLTNEYAAPIQFLEMLKAHDPLTTLTQRMDFLQAEYSERVTYELIVMVGSEPARRRAAERFREGNIVPTSGLLREADDMRSGLDEKLVAAKLSSPLYHCFLVVTCESQSQERLAELAHLAADLPQYGIPSHNQVVEAWVTPAYPIRGEADKSGLSAEGHLYSWVWRKESGWRDNLMLLHPNEIAALWHLPNETFMAAKINWAVKGAPKALTTIEKDALVLGTAATSGSREQVRISLSDRAYHHYIMGKTGMGKSTLMLNLILQDISAGRGVAVIDPHGKLVDDILERLDTRLDEVSVFDCGNTRHPVPLNPFRVPEGVSVEAVKTANLWALLKIYADIVDHARMRLVLGYVLDALLCDPKATPLDIRKLFTDASYRSALIAPMEESTHVATGAIDFWRSFGSLPRSDQREISEPILNRTGAFLGNRALENMTCHPQALNVVNLVKNQRIVMVNLAGEAIESEAGSFAALFLAAFFMANKTLGVLSDGSVPRYYLYVDEIERVATSAFAELLSQVRKFGLSLTLCNQYLARLSDDTLKAILGNVGTTVVFEVGNADAGTFTPYFEPDVERHQLINLGAYRAAVKTRYAGGTQPGFILNTLPAPSTLTNQGAQLRKNTISAHNMMTEAAVRKWLKQRYSGDSGEAAPTGGGGEPPKQPPPKPRRKTQYTDFDN